ncbi:MAG: hypothetical protein HRU14_05875, partial [Planctomycetes bacterium]|nr:hypothetical protein [Planctomycetota bacterium]
MLTLSVVALLVGVPVFTGCADQSWTAYERVPPQHVNLDGELVDLRAQPEDAARASNEGCVACHQNVGDPHQSSLGGITLRCIDCHGGNDKGKTKEEAHPRPRFPDAWSRDGEQSAANPEQSYALLNKEDPVWIRFVNPGDLRVANQACGGCHPAAVLNVSKSLMTTSAHFWGTAAYANGILPNKRSILGESYSPEGVAQKVNNVPDSPMTAAQMDKESVSPFLLPLPRFEAT